MARDEHQRLPPLSFPGATAPWNSVRWIGPSGTYIAKGDRGLAWRGAMGSPAPWRFKSDGDAESVYLCQRHHIVFVDELLYGEGREAG